jgi:hypothetical protein
VDILVSNVALTFNLCRYETESEEVEEVAPSLVLLKTYPVGGGRPAFWGSGSFPGRGGALQVESS